MMQSIPNAKARRPGRLALLSVLRAQGTRDDCYTIRVTGAGAVGSYGTPEEAEAARSLLPCSVRQHAAIYDQDGWCVTR